MLKDHNLNKLLTLRKEANPFLLSIKHKQRPTSERTTSDSNKKIPNYPLSSTNKKDPKSIHHRNNNPLYTLMHNTLYRKYNTTPINHLFIELENVIQSKYCRTLAVFKETLLFNYHDEFLKRYYRTKESEDRLPKFVAYYKNYLAFFCNAVFTELNLNDLIQVYNEQKAKIYYAENCRQKTDENGNKGKGKEHQHRHKRDEDIIFNTTIKDNISMNSFSTIILNRDEADREYNTRTMIQNPSNFINKSSAEAVNDLIDNLSPHKALKKTKDKTHVKAKAIMPTIPNLFNVSYPIQKLFLKKQIMKMKCNHIFSIDKTSSISKMKSKTFKAKRKTTSIILNTNINKNSSSIKSPHIKVQQRDMINRYICYTESNKVNNSNNNNYSTSRNREALTYLNNKTEVISPYKKDQDQTHDKDQALLLSKAKLFNKTSFTKTFNHSKNVFSTQMTDSITERLRKTVRMSSKKDTQGKSKGVPRQSMSITKTRKANNGLSIVKTKTSRNTKSDLEQPYYNTETSNLNKAKGKTTIKQVIEPKLSMFKTLVIKSMDKHLKKVSFHKKK